MNAILSVSDDWDRLASVDRARTKERFGNLDRTLK